MSHGSPRHVGLVHTPTPARIPQCHALVGTSRESSVFSEVDQTLKLDYYASRSHRPTRQNTASKIFHKRPENAHFTNCDLGPGHVTARSRLKCRRFSANRACVPRMRVISEARPSCDQASPTKFLVDDEPCSPLPPLPPVQIFVLVPDIRRVAKPLSASRNMGAT